MRHPNALGPDRPNTVLDRTFVQGRATIIKIVVSPLAFKGFGDRDAGDTPKKRSYYPVKRSDPRGGLWSRRRSRCRGRRARGRNPREWPEREGPLVGALWQGSIRVRPPAEVASGLEGSGSACWRRRSRIRRCGHRGRHWEWPETGRAHPAEAAGSGRWAGLSRKRTRRVSAGARRCRQTSGFRMPSPWVRPRGDGRGWARLSLDRQPLAREAT